MDATTILKHFTAHRVLFNNSDMSRPINIKEDSQIIDGQLLLLLPSMGNRLQSYLTTFLSHSMSQKVGMSDDWEDDVDMMQQMDYDGNQDIDGYDLKEAQDRDEDEDYYHEDDDALEHHFQMARETQNDRHEQMEGAWDAADNDDEWEDDNS